MRFLFDISERLSSEHQNVIRVLGRFGRFLASAGTDAEPDWTDPDVRELLGDLRIVVESEVPNHFTIEEEELFPRLLERGCGGMVNLLLGEHQIILGLIAEVAPIISTAATQRPVGKEDWKTLLEKGGILVSALSTHAEKEECGFVPRIDQLIDRESADRIFRRYQGM